MSLIAVKHNIEVAHRLYATPGKCEAIHGHSMDVTMALHGTINPETGMLAKQVVEEGREKYDDKLVWDDLEFGAIKRSFRAHLDEQYDHRVLLNAADPFAGPIFALERDPTNERVFQFTDDELKFLPGLNSVMGDPTTENIAKWIYEWGMGEGFPVSQVKVWETASNMAMYDGH